VTYLQELMRGPYRFDFLDMMRHVERSLGEQLSVPGVLSARRPRIGDSASRREEVVRLCAAAFQIEAPISFGQEPWMSFPGSTVREIALRWDKPREPLADEAIFRDAPPDRLHVVSAFLGMLGPQGALPYHLTEEAHAWALENDNSFIHFVDLFNNRFIQLFYRAWADPRPIVQADRPEYDRFGAYVATVIGVGSRAYEPLRLLQNAGDARVSSMIPSGMGLYAGLLGPQAKSASRLRQAIRGLLKVDIEVDEFVGSWLIFEDEERSTLGKRNSALGEDFLVGAASFSVQDKIRVRLFTSDMEQYCRFLPGGPDCDKLVDLMFFYFGDEIEWDVELALPSRCVEPFLLTPNEASDDGAMEERSGPRRPGARLGWTSWLVDRQPQPPEGYRSDARFQPAERKRLERETAKRDAELALR
jgi:type VI secretion system protein ImpH